MKRIATLIIVGLALGACSDAPTAERILRDSGYTDIKTSGHSFFGCSKDDTFATGFVAKAPAGRYVSGAVCSGWLKGGTIRLD